MKTIKTILTTEAVFSEDGSKRYLLKKTWDEKKPSLAVLMLAPSGASGIELDSTTQLVLNNAERLGYGRVSIANLFATLGDFALKHTEDEDEENLKLITAEAAKADAVVYAPGVGKAKNKAFLKRQTQVLEALRAYEKKLFCLCGASGEARLQHPLSPAVRVWHLSPLKVGELVKKEITTVAEALGKGQKKKAEAKQDGKRGAKASTDNGKDTKASGTDWLAKLAEKSGSTAEESESVRAAEGSAEKDSAPAEKAEPTSK